MSRVSLCDGRPIILLLLLLNTITNYRGLYFDRLPHLRKTPGEVTRNRCIRDIPAARVVVVVVVVDLHPTFQYFKYAYLFYTNNMT